MDDEDFLDAISADEEAVPAQEAKPEETTAEPPKQEEPVAPVTDQQIEAPTLTEPATPTEPSLTAPKQPDPGFVPIAAMLDARDKAKALEAELAQFRAQQAQAQAQHQVQIPDPIEDPEGYARFHQQATQQAVLNTRLDLSEEMARQVHGDEIVTAAQQWALQQYAQNPSYREEVLSQRNPYGYVVQQYKRTQALEKLGDTTEIDAFLAWKQAQAGLAQAAPTNGAAPPNTASAIPPKSLASAPSAGGINAQVELSEEDIFNEVIPKG